MLKIRKQRFSPRLKRSGGVSRKRFRLAVPLLSLVFIAALITVVAFGVNHDTKNTATVSSPTTSNQTIPVNQEKQEDIADIFNGYDNDLYDEGSNTYYFSSSDYDSLFKGTSLSDNGSGLRSGTISRNGQTWNIYCYSNLNSCSVSTSNGTYGNVSCYDYTNSCSYSDSAGNYANTYCYEYLNSCSTTGSDGYSSNTNCYEYLNSCSTTDSNGGYSNTYCYEYLNSCTTNNSDGSTTNTYCYEYLNSCSSSTYGGSSNYGSYGGYDSYDSYDYGY